MVSRQTQGNHRILRGAAVMSGMTAISRVFGYVRDKVVAYLLGTTLGADAFYLAFTIPNSFRRLVGEGAMTAAFVPVFADLRRQESPRRLWRFANRFFYTLATVLAAVVVLGMACSEGFVRLLLWGRPVAPDALALTVTLNRLIFPYLFFICLAALAMAILNTFGRFGLPAFTPVLLNLSIILAAWLIAPRFSEPALGLGIGVLLGGACQLGVQLPACWRLGMRFLPAVSFTDPRIRAVGRLMLPGVIGAGIQQINLLVGRFIAFRLYEGSLSSLYFSDRITELASGLFAVSLSTVILPSMSRDRAAGNLEGMVETLHLALRWVAFVILPATVGILLLREEIVSVLFLGGRFDAASLALTTRPLFFYALGLFAYAAARVVVPAFYSSRQMKAPVVVAAGTFGVNLLGIALFTGSLGHAGIALASAAAGYFNLCLLLLLLPRRTGISLRWRGLAVSLARTAAACGLMTAALWGARLGLARWGDAVPPVVGLVGLVVLGLAVFLVAAGLLGSREPGEVRAMWRAARVRRGPS